jgi:hypothetical protein
MFIAVLFIVGKLWNQIKCASVDEWIMWYIINIIYSFVDNTWYNTCYVIILYIYIYTSALIKKGDRSWLNLENLMLSEITRHRKTSTTYLTYMWNLKHKNLEKQKSSMVVT